MEKTANASAGQFSGLYPPPPRLHWAILLVALVVPELFAVFYLPHPFRDIVENIVIAVWPITLSIWVRRVDYRSASLYWALASLATGFLFSWILWIVVIYELREELLYHYNRREPIGLRLHWLPSLLFSVVYFQYHLRRIALEKDRLAVESASGTARS